MDFDVDYEDDYDDNDDANSVDNKFFDDFVNDDVPYVTYVQILEDSDRTTPGVVITTMNVEGEHCDSCYDLDSLESLINTLEECRVTLLEMTGSDDE